MGFIKWLKKEGHFSPSALKKVPNLTVTPNFKETQHLCHNESYLKALKKFNIWRNWDLTNNKQRREQSNKMNFSDEYHSEYYEEIDSSSDYENKTTAAMRYIMDGEDKESVTYDYSVESEYALPHNSDSCTQTKMITDLDRSLIESEKKNITYSIDETLEQCICDLGLSTSELIICSSKDILPTRTRATSGYLEHGCVDAIEISYNRHYKDYHSMLQCFNMLRKLRHPNIALLMGVCISDAGSLEALILEPLKCTLFERVYWQKKKISRNQCLAYAIQLTNAIIYLHKRFIVHSSIKSTSVLLCNSGSVVKLIGFEHSATCRTNDRVIDKCFYEAVAVDQFGGNLYKMDIYGVCLTLWEMLNCVIPHSKLSQYATLPMYERERCLPFKNVLERGLEINGNYIETAERLKNEFVCLRFKIVRKNRK